MSTSQFNKFHQRFLTRSIGLALAFSTGYANSQTADNNSPDVDDDEEKIVVVGSRIRADGFDRPSPVEVILADSAVSQGIGDIGELLRSSTVAAGSPQVTTASSTAFVQAGGTGAQTLSLRGLGANRTLVLLNGRRAGPAGTRGQVSSFDLNVLPLSAIDRVEILKDGASSLYGSDAVAGVVNIITKKGDGGNIDVNYSQPTRDGGEHFRVNATYGQTYERASFRATVDYNKQRELAKGDRDYFNCGERFIFDPDTGDRVDPIDPRTGKPHCEDLLWGHVWLYDYQGDGGNVPSGALVQYDYDGDLAQYIPGFAEDPNNPDFIRTPDNSRWFPVRYDRATDAASNADHPFQDEESLMPENELITLYLQGDYDVSDDVQAYAELLLNRRTTEVNGYRQFWSYVYNENFAAFGDGIGEGNGNSLSAGWTGAQWFSPTAITNHNDDKITVDYQRFVLGMTGEWDEWYWDVSVQHSRSEGEYQNDIIYDDSISDQNFLNGSCAGSTTSVNGFACVDIPWLDPQLLAGNISPEVQAFLFGRDVGNTEYTQTTVEGVISGNVFEMPAGPVGIALGASYQKDEIEDVPGEQTLAGNTWNDSAAGITQGDDNTVAVFGEVQIPLLRDAPMAEALDLQVSARYTDVDSYGSDTTYKVGLNWEIAEGFRLRASRGTSFRSPALFELFLADQTSSVRQSAADPCVQWQTNLDNGTISPTIAQNCAAEGIASDYAGGAISATVITGGGFGVLEAETSDATTIGLVWQPEFADLNISVDYFDIEVDDEVTSLGGTTVVRQCYESNDFANDPLCDLFERDPIDNRVDNIRDSFINVSSQKNRGVDVAIAYRQETEMGVVRLKTEHTFQIESTQQLFADSEIDDTNGEFGDPKHVATFEASVEKDDWTANWNVRYVGEVSNHRSFGNDVEEVFTTRYRGDDVRIVLESDAVFYHSFSLTKAFPEEGVTAVLGVANAFDQKPPRVTTLNLGEIQNQGDSAFYSQYDWLGRRVFLNVSYDF